MDSFSPASLCSRHNFALAGIIIGAVIIVISIIFYATVVPSIMQQAQLQQ